jgi:hypothetical protein
MNRTILDVLHPFYHDWCIPFLNYPFYRLELNASFVFC